MAKKETQQNENKIEQLKQQIDNWVSEFNNNNKNFDRFELYEGESLKLGFIAYRDKNNTTNVLISIHGKKPTNSVSFPSSSLSEIEKILELIAKYKELFEYVGKYQQKKERKVLLD
jgi:hypothetical protein